MYLSELRDHSAVDESAGRASGMEVFRGVAIVGHISGEGCQQILQIAFESAECLDGNCIRALADIERCSRGKRVADGRERRSQTRSFGLDPLVALEAVSAADLKQARICYVAV